MAITKKGNQPITASRTAMRPQPPVLANNALTSRDAQKMVRRPPEPFADPQGPLNTPTGRLNTKTLGIPYEVQSRGPKPQSYGKLVGVGNTSLSASEMAAIGYSPNATKSSNPIISGNPTRNQQRKMGPDSQPRATGGNGLNTRRTSQSIPAGETGKIPGDYGGMRDYTDPTGNKYTNGVMYTDGVKKGSRARGAALTSRPAQKKGEAKFYGQR